MAKYAYLNTQPSEIIFSDLGIFIKYESGCEKFQIGEQYYKISSLDKMIEILRDIVSISKMNESE